MTLVRNAVVDARGEGTAGSVEIRLVTSADPALAVEGWVPAAERSIGSSVVLPLAADGSWYADLRPNADVAVADTYYQVTERIFGTTTVENVGKIREQSASGATFSYNILVPAASDVDGYDPLVGVWVADLVTPDVLTPTAAPNPTTVPGAFTAQGTAYITGAFTAHGTSTLTGAVTAQNNLTVAGTTGLSGAVTAAGAVSVGGNLTVTGTSALTGAVSAAGSASVGGNLSVTGTSSLTGAVTASGAASVGGNLSVTGTSILTGAVTTSGAATIGGNLTANQNVTMGTGSAARALLLKSNPSSDDDIPGGVDGTSRLYLESYQRAGTNNYGEVVRISARKWAAKSMISWMFPDSYDGSGNPVGALNSKVWFGAHAQATGQDSNHNHLEVEVNDSKGFKRGRQTWDFAATTTVDGAASANDPASPGLGLDTTYIAFNQAHVIINNSSTRAWLGSDTTVPNGAKQPAYFRMNGSEGITQAIQFARDYYGSIRRWDIRNSSDPEGYVFTISGSPTGGTFTLTVRGQTTSAIAYNAAASAVQSALEALSLVGTGGVTVSGSAGGPYTVYFTANSLGSGSAPSATASFTGGSSPAITRTTAEIGAHFQINAYNDSGTLLGRAIHIDRTSGLITLGADSGYRSGGIVINKSNTGNALKIVNSFTGGTSFYANTADTTSRAFTADVTGDTSQRFVTYSTGKLEWGSGSASRDTNLYRSGAGALTTDGSLAVASLTVGGVAYSNSNPVSYVARTTDLSRTSTASLADDDQLTLSVSASGVYELFAFVVYDGATTGDIQFAWTVPTGSGASMIWNADTLASSASGDPSSTKKGAQSSALSAVTGGCLGAGTKLTAQMTGRIVVGATGGSVTLKWAQGTSDATASTLYTGSFLRLIKVA